MRLERAVNIADLRRMARRRLPRFLFDMIEGGVDDERQLKDNEEAFARRKLLPRVLVDVEARDQSTTLFGRRWSSPFGISATGPNALYRVHADEAMVDAAVGADIPYIQSGAGGISLEKMVKRGGDHLWYQLYAARDRDISRDIIKRAIDCGVEVLVYTVDFPVNTNRERGVRNRIGLPLKPQPDILARLLVEGVTHPAWTWDYLTSGGMPMNETWQAYAPKGASAGEVAAFFRSHSPSSQTWADVECFRALWPGKFVVKGVINPHDAARLVDMGVDGVTVSNHGGKILDRALAPLDALPYVRAAVGDRAVVMLDGGVRRGSDIVIARCLGADFVFTGRATLYAVAAAGRPGVEKAISILRNELDLTLGAMGCPRFDDLGPAYLDSGSRPTAAALPQADRPQPRSIKTSMRKNQGITP